VDHKSLPKTAKTGGRQRVRPAINPEPAGCTCKAATCPIPQPRQANFLHFSTHSSTKDRASHCFTNGFFLLFPSVKDGINILLWLCCYIDKEKQYIQKKSVMLLHPQRKTEYILINVFHPKY
jgi:hypothetical protein